MRLLSVVGLKTAEGRKATLVQATYSSSRKWTKLSRRLKYGVFFFALLVGIFLQTHQYPLATRAHESIVNFLSPLTAAVSKPYEWGVNLTNFFRSTTELIEENNTLKLQNDALLRQSHERLHVYLENEKLKDALNVKTILTEDILTARITHHIFDGYSAIYFIGAGEADNIQKNNPVLTTAGHLLGRIMSVGNEKSSFMPITDVISRVPVQISDTGKRAMLVGTGKSELKLTHLEDAAVIKVGQKLFTSGEGGIFAPGIPVAIVTSIKGEKITATPLATCKSLDFVLIISQFQA